MVGLYCGKTIYQFDALINSISGGGVLIGTNENDLIFGNGGNDTIFGKSGNDCIITGNGNNYISEGTGNEPYFVTNKYVSVALASLRLNGIIKTKSNTAEDIASNFVFI